MYAYPPSPQTHAHTHTHTHARTHAHTHPPPAEFWDAYHTVIPRAPGYERRAYLYELHHHLNHYNIFGAGYRGGALALMDRILGKR